MSDDTRMELIKAFATKLDTLKKDRFTGKLVFTTHIRQGGVAKVNVVVDNDLELPKQKY